MDLDGTRHQLRLFKQSVTIVEGMGSERSLGCLRGVLLRQEDAAKPHITSHMQDTIFQISSRETLAIGHDTQMYSSIKDPSVARKPPV